MKHEKVTDYIHVENAVPRNLCEQILTRIRAADWQKHSWRNNADNEISYEAENELDILPCPPDIQALLIPCLVQAATAYGAKFAYRTAQRRKRSCQRSVASALIAICPGTS